MTTINEISNHIMGYFNGTLDAFGYTAQSVNEISNPDESYMGTLNLQFREFIQDDEQDEDMISQYTSIYNAIEKMGIRPQGNRNLPTTCSIRII